MSVIELMKEEIENENIIRQGLTFLKKNIPIYIPEPKILTRIDQFMQNSLSKQEVFAQSSYFIRCVIKNNLSNVSIITSRKKEIKINNSISNEKQKIIIHDFVEFFTDKVSVPCKWTQSFMEFGFVSRLGQVQMFKDIKISFSEINDISTLTFNIYVPPLSDRISAVKEYKKQ